MSRNLFHAIRLVALLGTGCVDLGNDLVTDDPHALPEQGHACRPLAGTTDRDCDGLDDRLEVAIARRHAPWLRFAGREPGRGELDQPWSTRHDGACDLYECFTGCDDPRDALLGALGVPAPWSRVRENAAWPYQPFLRAPALARVTPAAHAPLDHVAYAKESGAVDGPGPPWGYYLDAECGGAPCPTACHGHPDCRFIDDSPGHLGHLVIRYSLVFASDGGKRIAGVSLTGHLGDSEAFALSLVRDAACEPPATPDGDGYRVVEVATAAHFNDPSFIESVHRYRVPEALGCRFGASFVDGADLDPDDPALGVERGVLFINAGKHGVYGTRDDCEWGGGAQDACDAPGWLTAIDPIDVGEPGPNRVVSHRVTEDASLAGHLAPDHPDVNPVAARAIPVPWSGERGLFPGEEDPWLPVEGGFSGGFRSERLYGACATSRRTMALHYMRDPLVHKLVGSVSPSTGHSMLPAPPGGALSPPFVARVTPAHLDEGGEQVVTLEGQLPLPDQIERITIGGRPAAPFAPLAFAERREADGTRTTYVTALAVRAPDCRHLPRGVPLPVEVTRAAAHPGAPRVRTLETVAGSPGWLTCR